MADDTPDEEKPVSATGEITRVAGRFVKGVSGNPGGRPIGSRNKINADFTRDLSKLWAEKGPFALEVALADDPMGFVRMVASLLPKDVTISARPFSEFTDDDLLHAVATIQGYLDAGGDPERIVPAIDGEATRVVSAIPEADGVPCGGEDVPRAGPDGSESGGEDTERGR